MANRKVLINRHTTGSTAPAPESMYYGEIAVAHKTGEETLWTKNNADEMVPFISCAQTITMINNAVSAANVTYDVKAATNDAHVEVATGGSADAKLYTVSSKDVQSEEEFKAYSARTNDALTGLTAAFEGLLDYAVTGLSGDSIIVATEVNPGTGANTYNLTHRTGEETEGFKKIKTDAYGHVIASSAVTADDLNGIINISELSASVVTNKTNIEALSAGTLHLSADTHNTIVKLSGDTEAAISKAIEGLGSVSASTGKYFTAIGVNGGALVKEEADLPTLSVTSAGTGNVVSQITVNGHEITYQTASVATSEGIEELSAATMSLSGVVEDNERVIAAAFNDVNGRIDTVSGNVNTNATNISNLSGAVVANEANIEDLSAATLALSAVTLTGVSLNNTPLTVSDHVVSVPVTTSGSGISSAANTGSVADALAVKEYVEDTLSSAVEYKGATGATPSNPAKGDLYIASSDFVVEGSKSAETGDFIIYDGTKWDVIEKNLDGAITGNLTQNTVTLGDSTNSVVSLAAGTAGQVLTQGANAPEWANLPQLSTATTGAGNVVSEITVNDHQVTYVKDFTAATEANLTALSAGTIALVGASAASVYSSGASYTDEKIAEEIGKLDSSTATTDSGHYLTSITITDGVITAMGEEVVPAATPVTTVAGTTGSTASPVLTGIVTGGTDGHELTLNATNKIFSAETTNSAITSESALTAVHANAASKVDSAITINVLTSAGTTASTVTFDGSENKSIDIPGSHDTATTEDGHYTPATAASAFTAPAGAFLSAVSVDSKNHVLEVAYADKINSAFTSESAITSVSAAVATNAAHASAATKVDSALTMTDVVGTNSVVFDGSANRTVTFGTATNIANENSMTMDANGVVDVNIIDCGSY